VPPARHALSWLARTLQYLGRHGAWCHPHAPSSGAKATDGVSLRLREASHCETPPMRLSPSADGRSPEVKGERAGHVTRFMVQAAPGAGTC